MDGPGRIEDTKKHWTPGNQPTVVQPPEFAFVRFFVSPPHPSCLCLGSPISPFHAQAAVHDLC